MNIEEIKESFRKIEKGEVSKEEALLLLEKITKSIESFTSLLEKLKKIKENKSLIDNLKKEVEDSF